MLYTNLKHIETAADYAKVTSENESVMLICGRMDVSSISVYRIAEELQPNYKLVKFFDIEIDNPQLHIIQNLSEVKNFKDTPFTLYYKNGKVTFATSGIQTKEQVKRILNTAFMNLESA